MKKSATPAVSAVERRPISELRESPENPRTIAPARLEQLKRALVADPEMLEARPVIALPDGTVIAGNMRLLAARELGWDAIPCVVADLDRERARLWMLRDNQGYGEWEDVGLAALLAELQADGADLDLSGFAEAELAELLARSKERLMEPDDAPPLRDDVLPDSQPGEVYELGPHRLLCGDSADPDRVAALMGGESAEVIWTDPPYGVAYVGKTAEALTIDGDDDPDLGLLEAVWASVGPFCAPGARIYCCAPPGPNGLRFMTAFEGAGWRLHQTLVWVKDVFVLGHTDYHYAHELILYGYAPGDGRPGRGAHQGSRWYGDHAQPSVFAVPRPKASREHPTMKPVALVEAALKNSSRGGDVVLDPFAGSGSTLIACETLGRRCRAVEIDPRYCDVIRRRYQEFAGG